MNTRTTVSCWRRILAPFLLIIGCTGAFGQDNIAFLYPPDNARRPINFDQSVTVEWIVGGTPIRGPVSLTTTIGTVAIPTVMTDDFGQATFVVNSDSTGIATLEVSTPTESDTRQLEFAVPTPDNDLLHLIPDKPPFGEFSVLRRDDSGTRYWLAKDRIAIRLAGGFLMSDIEDFINDNNVIDRFHISNTLLVLVFDEKSRTRPLREMTRELQDLVRPTTTFKPIRKAGLVARLDKSEQAYMVPDEIIVRFFSAPNTTEQDEFKMDFKLADLSQLGSNPNRFLAKVHISQVRTPFNWQRK